MIKSVWESFTSRPEFYGSLTLDHLKISLLSILIAGVIGLIIGILISEYKKSSKVVLTTINIIYTIPSISLLGILIPLSGIGNKTAIIALTVYALLPMVRNTYTGISNIDPKIIEAARGMGSTDLQVLWKIKLPLAFPIIMSGLRNMVTMTIALAGIASFIGAGGLGVAIYRGITTNNIEMTITGSLLIALMALIVDFILGSLENRLNNHRKIKKSTKIIGLVVGLLILFTAVASALIPNSKGIIKIATKPMTEQYILGEMLKMLIEDETDLEVELTPGVGGGTSNIQPGMVAKEFDLYPEYTGTGWANVLKRKELYQEDMFDELKSEYDEKFGFEWINPYGFQNTYSLAVRKEIAEKYDIKTFSDLAPYTDDLIFGANYDFFERADGYNSLVEKYDYNFESTMDIDIGLMYKAIKEGKVDVISVFTTDGQIGISDIVVLEDDKKHYPSYMCMNIIRSEVLDKHPEIKDVLSQLDNKFTDATMIDMNYQVEEEGAEPRDVAREFLESNNLLNKNK